MERARLNRLANKAAANARKGKAELEKIRSRPVLVDSPPPIAEAPLPQPAAKPEAVPVTADKVREEVARLAGLDPVEYELTRKEVAKVLGIDAAVLKAAVNAYKKAQAAEASTDLLSRQIEPWPDPVNGKELLSEIRQAVQNYLVLPKTSATAIALWVVHAHSIETCSHSPILWVNSPTKGCGKTTLLDLLTRLVPRPLPAANVTAATVFRSIQAHCPTFLIDEADTFLQGKEELRGVLNSGHQRSLAYVLRCVGQEMTPTQFSTWCPKVFASIVDSGSPIPPTLEDRSICIRLERRLPGESVKRLLPVRPGKVDPLAVLASKCVRWVGDNFDALRAPGKLPYGTLDNRARDNWRPLFAIAKAAGWDKAAGEASLALTTVREDESSAIILLGDLRALFAKERAAFLKSSLIVEQLAKMEDRPWADFRNGRALTANALARMLKPFGVALTRTPVKRGLGSERVYSRAHLLHVWQRYLPRLPSEGMV